MATAMVEEHVTRLEDAMAAAWEAIERAARQSERTERELDRLSREMREFKTEMRVSRDEMNKKWGELAHKMGTMAEDLVAPSIPRILSEFTGCPPDQIEWLAIRLKRRHSTELGRSQEFDVVAACGEHVLINKTKSSLDVDDVKDFITLLSEAHGFFPEYADRHFIGAIASLHVDESVARYGQKQGVIVLSWGADVMEVLNEPGFELRRF